MLIAGRPPNKLTWSALSLVILERTFDDISLLERSVLVQRHDSAGIELEQRGGDAGVARIQHLDRDPGKLSFLPRHIGNVEVMCRALRWVIGLDVGMHQLASLRGHVNLLGSELRCP